MANIIGLYAFFNERMSYDASFSSIACSTYSVHFSKLRAHERLGALPLHEDVAKTKLKFYQGQSFSGGHRWGFGAVEEPQGDDTV